MTDFKKVIGGLVPLNSNNIQFGHSYIQGDNVNAKLSTYITFPTAFSSIPEVLVSFAGYTGNTTYGNQSDIACMARASGISTSGFLLTIQDLNGLALANTRYHWACWRAFVNEIQISTRIVDNRLRIFRYGGGSNNTTIYFDMNFIKNTIV